MEGQRVNPQFSGLPFKSLSKSPEANASPIPLLREAETSLNYLEMINRDPVNPILVRILN